MRAGPGIAAGAALPAGLTIALTALKLLRAVTWPWWLVLSPAWATAALITILAAGTVTVTAARDSRPDRHPGGEEQVKAIICKGGGIGVHITSFGTDWTYCQCGNTRAKWLDPGAGTMVADCRYPAATREDVRFLGMSRAGCWAMPARIGSTSDTRWAADDERGEPWNPPVTLPPVPAAVPGGGGEYAAEPFLAVTPGPLERPAPRPFPYPVGGVAE